MTNDNDLLLLASSQNNGTYKVYIDSSCKKTLTPQTANYEAIYKSPWVCYHSSGTAEGLLTGKNPKKVELPNCIKAGGHFDEGAFDQAFYGCTSLTSVSFPALTTATGGLSASSSSAWGAFRQAFYGCTSLTSVSFPALTTINTSSVINFTFMLAFIGCSPSLKVHFKKSMKGTIGLDYQIMGLTSADQVVFDLP